MFAGEDLGSNSDEGDLVVNEASSSDDEHIAELALHGYGKYQH